MNQINDYLFITAMWLWAPQVLDRGIILFIFDRSTQYSTWPQNAFSIWKHEGLLLVHSAFYALALPYFCHYHYIEPSLCVSLHLLCIVFCLKLWLPSRTWLHCNSILLDCRRNTSIFTEGRLIELCGSLGGSGLDVVRLFAPGHSCCFGIWLILSLT